MKRHFGLRSAVFVAVMGLVMAGCGGNGGEGEDPAATAADATTEPADGQADATAAAGECTNAEILAEVQDLGPDERAQRLAELAEEAGNTTVALHSTTGQEDLQVLIDEFSSQYEGFTVEVLAGSGTELLQRLTQEHQAGQVSADALVASAESLVVFSEEGGLTQVDSPHADNLYDDSVHDDWYGLQFNALLVQRHEELISEDEAPRTYQDLAGMNANLALNPDNWDHFMAIVKYWMENEGMSEEEAIQTWEEIVSTNTVRTYTSNTPMAESVQNGENDLAITFHHYYPRFHREGDSPIAWEPSVEPVVARQNGIGVPCGAPHPALGMLWLDFQISPEIQELFGEELGRDVADTSVSSGVSASDEDYEIIFVDPSDVLNEQDKWRPIWEDMLRGAGAP